MVIFNALLNLSELKELYSGKPVCVCPLYNGVLNDTKPFEATGNPITIPEYKSLVKLKTDFSPKQAGTGDPSPENVRPISGWDSIKLAVSNESESHDYELTLPKTIYGGTVDAVTGAGSEEWGSVTLGEKISERNIIGFGIENENFNRFGFNTFLIDSAREQDDGFCNMFPVVKTWNASIKNGVSIGQKNKVIYFHLEKTYCPDIQAAIDIINGFIDAGTPVQVAYKLATPEPFEISQVSIPSLKSKNTFFTNGENMDIIYNGSSFWG